MRHGRAVGSIGQAMDFCGRIDRIAVWICPGPRCGRCTSSRGSGRSRRSPRLGATRPARCPSSSRRSSAPPASRCSTASAGGCSSPTPGSCSSSTPSASCARGGRAPGPRGGHDEVAGTIRVATFASSAATLLAPSIVSGDRAPSAALGADRRGRRRRRGRARRARRRRPRVRPRLPRRARPAGARRRAPPPGDGAVHARRSPAPADAASARRPWPPSADPPARGHELRPRRVRRLPPGGVRAARRPRGHDTAVSLAIAAQGSGSTTTTPMMLTLLPAPGLVRHDLADDVRRDVVVIQRRGSQQRPTTVAAVTAIIRAVVAPFDR